MTPFASLGVLTDGAAAAGASALLLECPADIATAATGGLLARLGCSLGRNQRIKIGPQVRAIGRRASQENASKLISAGEP